MIKLLQAAVVSTWKGSLALCFAALFLAVVGCSSNPQPESSPDTEATADRTPTRVLVVDDAEMAEAIQREWLARAGREIVIRRISSQQLLDATSNRLGADVIVYPSGLLGHLAARGLIEPLSGDATADSVPDNQDLYELLRLREVHWGTETYAVSLGSPAFVLFYRSDVLQEHGLSVPDTWDDYTTLVQRLAALQDDGESWFPVMEPLGSGWAGQVLLARAASYAKHRSQFSALFEYRTMKPLIASPAWTRAMEDLRSIAAHFPPQAATMQPSDVRREFLAGNCAIAMTWASRADDQSEVVADVEFGVAFAELPGSVAAYNYRSQQWENRGESAQQRVTLLGVSGRLGSVTSESRQAHEAVNMLNWLSGELSGQICPESKHTTLFRDSHLERVDLWVDSQLDEKAAANYGEMVQQALSRSGWLCSVRVPGRDRYLAALDAAVNAVLDGKATGEEALTAAAQAWEEITESLGRDAQREAYMRSIGLEP